MMAVLASSIVLVILVAYDFWSTRKVSSRYVVGGRLPHLRAASKDTHQQNCSADAFAAWRNPWRGDGS